MRQRALFVRGGENAKGRSHFLATSCSQFVPSCSGIGGLIGVNQTRTSSITDHSRRAPTPTNGAIKMPTAT
eukprot:scaffold3888_cov135-Skeletonema_menzelii.AAC.1